MGVKEAAAAEAKAGWVESWASVQQSCVRGAVEFLAEIYMRHPEDSSQTVFAAESGYGSLDPLEQEAPDSLYETLLGDQLEAALCHQWLVAAANHLLTASGAGPLQVWAEQERQKRGMGSGGEAIAADGGFEMGLDSLASEAAHDLIVELGEMSVAEVITQAKGPEALSTLQNRQNKREARSAGPRKKQ